MPLHQTTVQQIAAHIRAELTQRQRPAPPFALCVLERTPGKHSVYWTASPWDRTNAPHSSITRMLQYLGAQDWWRQARNLEVYPCNGYRPTPMCEGMERFFGCKSVTLNLNRSSSSASLPIDERAVQEITDDPGARTELDQFKADSAGPPPTDVDLIRVATAPRDNGEKRSTLHRIYMMAAFALIEGRSVRERHEGHNIGAVLVSREGQILSWGLNQSNLNQIFHAELNALQACWKHVGLIPAGSVLFTTLQPCCMCAGMIVHTGVERIYMGQRDNGEHASRTALDTGYELIGRKHFLGTTDSTKAIAVYESAGYDPQTPKAGRQTENLANRLHKIHTDANNKWITRTLNSNEHWKTAVRQTSLTLLRTAYKYDIDEGHKPTVRSVLRHVAPFVNAHGSDEYRAIFKKLNLQQWKMPASSASGAAGPLVHSNTPSTSGSALPSSGRSRWPDMPSTSGSLHGPRPLNASRLGARPTPPARPSLHGASEPMAERKQRLVTLALLGFHSIMNGVVGKGFENCLSTCPGAFSEMKTNLERLVMNMVTTEVENSSFEIHDFNKRVKALVVTCGETVCLEQGVSLPQ